MAALPAVRTEGVLAENDPIEGVASRTSDEGGNDWIAGFGRLPFVRQIGMLFGLAGSIGIVAAVLLWMEEPDYRPLSGGWSMADLSQVADVLATRGVDFRLQTDSAIVMVRAADLDAARLALASADLIGAGGRGFELLDEDPGFGASQFAESSRHQRALEGELARTIAKLNPVREARVHLALPRQTAFVGAERAASAAVTLTLVAGGAVTPAQTRAITNLVAAAVPGLEPARVAVVDQRGTLLSEQDRSAADSEADWQYRYARTYERDLLSKIDHLVGAFVGERRFRTQVTAEMDFTWQEETAEQLDPDLPALRSEQVIAQSRSGSANTAEGVPGALSNQPPAVAQAPQTSSDSAAAKAAGAASNSQETTRNFEFSRAISHTRKPQGRPTRLTVAVLLDDIAAVDEGGALVYEQWSQGELDRLSALVKSAIGYEAARGDIVTVVNAPFVEEPEPPAIETPWWEAPWVATLSKQIAGVLGLVLLGLLVLRPLLQKLATVPSSTGGGDGFGDDLPTSPLGDQQLDEALDDVVSLTQSGRSLLAHQAGYGASLDAVRSLIAEDPARVAAVVKGWVAAGE